MRSNGGETIQLGHGDGGVLTRQLIKHLFLRYFKSTQIQEMDDAAVFRTGGRSGAITTDTFVVSPLFFPGGDIGRLSVCGTVNDLAVNGAVPRYLAAAFTIEEGFGVPVLERIVRSMADAARESGVQVIAADTKVVEKGSADGIFITTTGYGPVRRGLRLGVRMIRSGDRLVVSGNVGEHGLTVLLAREQFGLHAEIRSDCAPLADVIDRLLSECTGIRFLRDLTRGGLATALTEVAESCGLDVIVEESQVPVSSACAGVADILGLDPLYLACEGKFLAVVDARYAEEALCCLRQHPLGSGAKLVGQFRTGKGQVFLRTAVGGTRRLLPLSGRPLPRIC